MEMNRFMLFPNYQYYDSTNGTITTDYERPLRDYRIYGNSIQDGTPSPDNPVEIRSVGEYDEATSKYKISVEVSYDNRNLFDETKLIDLGFELQDDGRYYIKSTQNLVIWENIEGISGRLNIRFKYEYATTGPGFSLQTFYTDGTSKWGVGITDDSKTVDKVQLSKSAERDNWISDVLITTDIASNDYEPHIPAQTHDIFLDEPLRKCGEYADYIDFKNGKVVRNTAKGYVTKASFIHSKKTNHCCMTVERTVSPLANTPVLSVSFPNASNRWDATFESIFTHSGLNGYTYLKVNWNRLGLIYDGTTVYVEGDETQTALTDTQIANYFTNYLNNLSEEQKELLCVIPATETIIENLPTIQPHKGTNKIKVKTAIQPSQVDWQYYN